MALLDDIFGELLKATQVDQEAMNEARFRRDLVLDVALTFDGAYRRIKSGSVAHGTLSGTVTDADGTVLLKRGEYPAFTPDGDNKGPRELVEDLADYIRAYILQIYPNAWISTSHKRAILIRFRQPLNNGQDPSVDLIVAFRRKNAPGIWIPNLKRNIWQPSHPELHTQLVWAKRDQTRGKSTKIVRLSKLYAKQWSPPLLHSFHSTALMLEDFELGMSVSEGFASLLAHSAKSLENGNTPDPAGVSEPIKIPEGRDRTTLVKKLSAAAAHLEKAEALEAEGNENFDEIMEELGKVFWQDSIQQTLNNSAQKVRLDRAIEQSKHERPAYSIGVNVPYSSRPTISTRAYAAASTHHPVSSLFSLPVLTNETRDWFEKGVSSSEYLVFNSFETAAGRTYLVGVPVPEYKTSILVRIEIAGRNANVFADGLKDLRHINTPGNSLCLWFPLDSERRRWTFEKGVLALLDLTRLHLYKELRFKETGKWPGEEVHN